MSIFATSYIRTLLGDSTNEYIINGLLLTAIFYIVWRYIFKPAENIIRSALLVLQQRELQMLEITPPKLNEVYPLSTTNLFNIVRQQLGKYGVLSLEIASSKNDGIRYRIIASARLIPSMQKHLASYMPELRFKQTNTVPALPRGTHIYGFKQARHFAYPLKMNMDLAQSDSIAFMTGSMTQLEKDEQMTLQIVVRSFSSRLADRIYNKLLKNGRARIDTGIIYYLKAYSWVWVPSLLIALLTSNWAVGLIVVGIIWFPSLFMDKKEIQLTHLEEKLYDEIAAKLDQPLLQTDIRLAVYSPERTTNLLNNFIATFEAVNTAGFQSLSLTSEIFGSLQLKYRTRLTNHRVTSILNSNSSILSSAELGTIFHFPYGLAKTAGLARSHSKTLPAPISMQEDASFDVTIGVNKHHGIETTIGLTKSERERHMFVVGGTGSGKTTMLKYQIIQDMQNGKGLAVIDPHGDLAEELLMHIPKDRVKDLIYLNPDDLDHPIGVNLLELPEGLSGNDLLREKDRVTESVVSVMRKIFSEDDSGGHRVEYVLRNAVQTALTTKGATLFTIFRLLNDGKYAKTVIKDLKDEDLKAFWKNELGKAGGMQKVKMAAGITAKIGRFLFSASARAMLEQEKSTINFDEILDGKILICNFSKGRLGEDTSILFGVTILAKLQLAALKRSEKKITDRRPFYLYVDEFQNFATMSFTQMLSEARKYKVYLTMAEQSTQQQDDQKLVNIILANVGTVIAFRTGSPKDEELLLPLFEPYVDKGEIANLPAYTFYARVLGIEPQEPMSGETLPP